MEGNTYELAACCNIHNLCLKGLSLLLRLVACVISSHQYDLVVLLKMIYRVQIVVLAGLSVDVLVAAVALCQLKHCGLIPP